MIDKNNTQLSELFMARREICPDCKKPAFCTGTHNASGEEGQARVTDRYFTCSNVPFCGAGFVLTESFSRYTKQPSINLDDVNVNELLNSLNPDTVNKLKEKLELV